MTLIRFPTLECYGYAAIQYDYYWVIHRAGSRRAVWEAQTERDAARWMRDHRLDR